MFTNRSEDSVKYKKDCPDFIKLKDGTLIGDYRYCQLSTKCRQVGYKDGTPVPMETHYCEVKDPKTNETLYWEYFCTGLYDKREREARLAEDEKVS